MMKFELQTVEMLRQFCGRSDGEYAIPENFAPPSEFLAQKIKVYRYGGVAVLSWKFRRDLNEHTTAHFCKMNTQLEAYKSEQELYFHDRARITNGSQSKSLFDCKRGLWGSFLDQNDDPANAIVGPIRRFSRIEGLYELRDQLAEKMSPPQIAEAQKLAREWKPNR